MKTVSSSKMNEIDAKAQEVYGIPQAALMESAGRAVYEEIYNDFSHSLKDQTIGIFCGRGNNGGDGFVLARYLYSEKPQDLKVFILDDSIRQGAASVNFDIIKKMGLDILPVQKYFSSDFLFSIVVDAVFGTGFKGGLPELVSNIFEKINKSDSKKYALDTPSGLNATTGELDLNTCRANKTITFGLAKRGFYEGDASSKTGEVVVKNIGFPRELLELN